MNRLLGALVPRRLRQALTEQQHLVNRVDDLEKVILRHEARLARLPSRPPGHAPINEYERRVYSQNGEDGILEFIFERIGTTDKRFVEFGIQDGRECNTANLSLTHGWSGLLLDGDCDAVEKAKAYYASQLGDKADRVRLRCDWITAENIDSLLREEGVEGPIDLLSIDIDGNDLWVWEAITAIQPRVVVIEYNSAFGPSRSISTRYDPEFERFGKHPSGLYHGASITALAKSGRRRGYLLAGCDTAGVNAFFVEERAEAGSLLGEIPAFIAYYPQSRRFALSPDEQYEAVADLGFAEI